MRSEPGYPIAQHPGMSETTVKKVELWDASAGREGETLLAHGASMAMRMWHEQPGEQKEAVARDYETVGYVLEGSAEIEAEGKSLTVKAGDSWVVPKGATHKYRILENFRAVEATHPPASRE